MIGTTAAILGAAAIGGIGSIASGVIGANAADKAAGIQADSADKSLLLQAGQYAQSRADSLPWMEAGKTALAAYQNELGLGPEAKAGTYKSSFQTTPGYNFAVTEGEKGITNNLAALGMKNSGSALKALTRFRTGLADQTYGSYMDRLSGASVGGQTTAANTGQLGANYAANAGQTMADAGAARASGYVGSANAWQGALTGLSSTAGNALGWMGGSNKLAKN